MNTAASRSVFSTLSFVRRHLRASAAAIAFVLLAFPAAVMADIGPTAKPDRDAATWLAGGIGLGKLGNLDAFTARAELAVGVGIQFASLRYSYTEDNDSECDVTCFSLPRSYANELALQYGVKKRLPYFLGTAAAGAAAVWGVERGSTLISTNCSYGSFCVSTFDSTKFHTVGGTIELGGYLTSRMFSVGPTFIADINPRDSFWAVLLDVHFGLMGDARRIGRP